MRCKYLTSGRVRAGPTDRLRIFSSSAPVLNVVTDVPVFDGLLHLVRIEYTSTTTMVRVLVDGAEAIPNTLTGYDFSSSDITELWREASGTGNLSGIIANLKITDNGTLIRSYAIGDNSDILVNGATELGANEWSSSSIDAGSGWADNLDGSYTKAATGFSRIGFDIGNATLEPFTTYLIDVDVSTVTDALRIFLNDGGPYLATHTLPSGKSTVAITTLSEPVLVFDDSEFTGTISGLRVRQADGYGTIINGLANDWGLFQEQSIGGDWLGQELAAVNSTPLLGDDSDPEFFTIGDVTEGITYSISAEFTNTGNHGAASGWSSTRGVPSSAPFRSASWTPGIIIGGEFVASSSGSLQLFGRAAPGDSSYSNCTAKELLKVAL